MPKSKVKWEEGFDELYLNIHKLYLNLDWVTLDTSNKLKKESEPIKSFIHQTLTQFLSDIVPEVQRHYDDPRASGRFKDIEAGHNSCCQEIKDRAKDLYGVIIEK